MSKLKIKNKNYYKSVSKKKSKKKSRNYYKSVSKKKYKSKSSIKRKVRRSRNRKDGSSGSIGAAVPSTFENLLISNNGTLTFRHIRLFINNSIQNFSNITVYREYNFMQDIYDYYFYLNGEREYYNLYDVIDFEI